MRKRLTMKKSILVAVAVALCRLAMVHAGEWQVDKEAEGNRVTFTSQVLGFSFQGVTDQIDGYLYWEGEKLFEKNSQLLFQVELNSLDTGIGKRDRDMRKVLKTDKWPRARLSSEFTLRLEDFQIEAPSLAAFIKVSQEIQVSVSCYLKQQPR